MLRQRGFTLLEVLLVVLLMGLAASAVTLTIGNSSKQQDLDKLAAQFVAATDLVLDETVLSGQLLGVVVEDERYQYVYFKEEKWHPVPQDRLLAEKQMPDGVTLHLVLDGLPLVQDDEEDESWFDEPFIEIENEEQEKHPEPQILLLPSGEITAFELAFVSKSGSNDAVEALVIGTSLGQLTIGRPNDAPR